MTVREWLFSDEDSGVRLDSWLAEDMSRAINPMRRSLGGWDVALTENGQVVARAHSAQLYDAWDRCLDELAKAES